MLFAASSPLPPIDRGRVVEAATKRRRQEETQWVSS